MNGVTLAFLHAAKGLVGRRGLWRPQRGASMPITFATTPDEVDEERRLWGHHAPRSDCG